MDILYIVANVDFSTVYGGLGVLRGRGRAFEGLIFGLILPSLISVAHPSLSMGQEISACSVVDGQNKSFSLQNVLYALNLRRQTTQISQWCFNILEGHFYSHF